MDEALKLDAPVRESRWTRTRKRVRAAAPTRVEVALAASSAALLILSFPDFQIWPLAWVGLAPLFLAIVRRKAQSGHAFLLGWLWGTLFFYGTCYWLTYAMIHYGHIPAWAAYLLVLIPPLVVGLFPALCCLFVARAVRRWGVRALLLAPILWATLEWARLGLTGQLWNAVGYSQAYARPLIQAARWGGVYLVGFLIVTVGATIALLILERSARAFKLSAAALLFVAVIISAAYLSAGPDASLAAQTKPAAIVVAVQPNVPMDPMDLPTEAALVERHSLLSESGLQERSELAGVPRVLIWPESPMNFRYARDSQFREFLSGFAARHHTSILFNAQEPAPADGVYNSAVMVNEEGRLVAQYDKIRLLPFGEYVPLPRWLPGVSAIPTMVGDFTPGAQYTLMPLGEARAGVFICFESAFPAISRQFADAGADVLVNISNDGYLGPTPVMRQHLANIVFRAVENDRTVVRVTNTGITALITGQGQVMDATTGFQPAVRTWAVGRAAEGKTFYTRFGDVFVWLCAGVSLVVVALSWRKMRQA